MQQIKNKTGEINEDSSIKKRKVLYNFYYREVLELKSNNEFRDNVMKYLEVLLD